MRALKLMGLFRVKEELIQGLTVFGLSVNQAKVYLSIIQSTETNVNTISSTTKIHQQDIYKILPKLEEIGLITKTVDRPVVIKAIHPEEALNHIIATEQHKANLKINHLKKIVKALAQTIEKTREQNQTAQEQMEIQAAFITTDNAVSNKLDAAFGNATIQCDLVINFELIRRRLSIMEKRYKTLSTNKVKTRILIDNVKNVENAEKLLEQIIPRTGDFTVKQASRITVKPYLIIDNKEIYIRSQRKTPHNFPCVLWTNSKNIIAVYQENFEKAWDKSQLLTIHQQSAR